MLRRLITICLLLAPVAWPGCRPDGTPLSLPRPAADPPPRTPLPPLASQPAPSGELPQFRSVISLQILRVELPVGTVNASEQLWNYLNEEPVAVNRSAELGRNGLRMGLGEAPAWGEVSGMFQKLTGRALAPTRAFAWPGTVMDVVARKDRPAQSIFLFYADKTRTGSDYPPGDNVFAVACTVDETNPQGVILTGVPQIRATQSDFQPTRPDARMGVVTPYTRTPFAPLTFRVTIPPKGFLVIAPARAALNASTLGHHFLIEQRDGLSFETVLIVVPEVIRKPIRPAGAEDSASDAAP
ncbi:MAG: hypothetical protein NT031_16775 [Planctomycetota bacterium]|nr:hypothetical protein [Planctomycetota bacterium]